MLGQWRRMISSDLARVHELAEQIHPDYPERPEVFASRLRLFPAGSFVAIGGGAPVGYCLSHPGVLGEPVPLDTIFEALPDNADCLYLHDMAFLPEWRRSGLGAVLMERLAALARELSFSTIALTAVNNSAAYWRKHGFHPVGNQDLVGKLASYDDGNAAYMVREV